jgi:MFS family permease
LLTAVYFISFASFQLPLGILLDRYGPRRIEAALLLVAGLGAFFFARAESLTGLVVGRALIGFGVSSCLMAAFKAYTLWFSKEKWPMVNGFQMAAGGLGALAATSPVESALQFTDWRGIFTILGALTLVIAVLVFVVVPEKKAPTQGESFHQQMRGVRQVFTSPHFWRTAPLTTMSQTAFLSIQGLWAGPWLKDVAQLDRAAVADALFWVALAMIAGFVSLGMVVERFSRRGVSVLTMAVVGMTLFMLVQLLIIAAPDGLVLPLWMAFGFLGTSGILSYSALSQSFPAGLSGRVTTAVNLLVFIAAFAGQWLIGAIIALWPVGEEGQLAAAGFSAGFGLILVLQLLCLAYFVVAGRGRQKTKAA